MLPGVIIRGELTPNTFKGVEKWQICSVSLYGNRYFMLLPQKIVPAYRFSLCEYTYLSYDVASGSEIKPCNKIDKPLVVYRFWETL